MKTKAKVRTWARAVAVAVAGLAATTVSAQFAIDWFTVGGGGGKGELSNFRAFLKNIEPGRVRMVILAL